MSESFDFMKMNGDLWLLWGGYWLLAARKTSKTKTSETLGARLQHLVPLLFAFLLLFGNFTLPLLSHRILPEAASVGGIGILVTACGLAFATWARNHLGKYWSGIITVKEGHKLIRTGPYRFVRHPIYTGFAIGILGSAVSLGKIRGVCAVVMIVAVYLIKIRREEAVLVGQFGEEYIQYQKKVSSLFPYVF